MIRRRRAAVLLVAVLVAGGCTDELGVDSRADSTNVGKEARPGRQGKRRAGGAGPSQPARRGATTAPTAAAPPADSTPRATAVPPTSIAATTMPAPTTSAAPAEMAPPIVATEQARGVPAVDAKAYAVFDPVTGELLAAHDADRQLPVGSVMKLLTAYVGYSAGKPHKIVTAPEKLLISYEESAIGIYPGEQLPRDLLIRALLIVSANDAARALAVDIAGSEAAFAEQMTAAARSLGLPNTRAANPTGLDAEGHYSSASDMVRLGALLMQDATFRETVARPDAMLHDLTLPATNDWKALYPGATGIKTGRTTNAGYCIVGSAARDGRELIVAVFGAPTEAARNAGATALLDWGFRQ